MYRCLRCGEVSDYTDLSFRDVCYGECYGMAAFCSELCCSYCGYEVVAEEDDEERRR